MSKKTRAERKRDNKWHENWPQKLGELAKRSKRVEDELQKVINDSSKINEWSEATIPEMVERVKEANEINFILNQFHVILIPKSINPWDLIFGEEENRAIIWKR